MGMLAEQTLGMEGYAMVMPYLAGNGSLDAQPPGMISRLETFYPLDGLMSQLSFCQDAGPWSSSPLHTLLRGPTHCTALMGCG